MAKRFAMVAPAVVGLAALLGLAAALGEDAAELAKHLAELRSQLQERSLPIGQRERLALDMAATLDRAAESAPTPEARRARWTEAIGLLDGFRDDNAGQPQARAFRLQAAVYLWARGASWAAQWEFSPTDDEARRRAVADLDAAVGRLRPLARELGGDGPLAENARFRLAQALEDRAELERAGSEERLRLEREALEALDAPIKEPALAGFAHLLRAEVLGQLGRFGPAEAEVEAAAASKPAPPAEPALRVKAGVLAGAGRFDRALRAIDESTLDAPVKDLLAVRVLLTQRAGVPEGSARAEAERALFARIKALKGTGKPQARPALLALARGLDLPDEGQPAEAWEAVAEGAMLLGEFRRAAALETKAAERADAGNEPERAAACRLRAGALDFRAGRFAQADEVLSRVFEDPKAGPSRPRAGLLRALARGRALASSRSGYTQRDYLGALEALIRGFPGDAAANEARWLLGRARLAEAKTGEAVRLWAEIPHRDPRWLDARLGVAAVRQEELDDQRLNNDRDLVTRRFEEARSFLAASLKEAEGMTERNELQLALARLDLTPGAGRPDEAREMCEQIARVSSQAEQRDRATRLRVVSMVQLHRFLEAEQEARELARLAKPTELLETVRLLDHTAAESESDLRMRRCGLILRILLDRVMQDPAGLGPEGKIEGRVRQTRALYFSGDDERARASIGSWGSLPSPAPDRLLRDVADTYLRLELYERAADAERLRAQRLPTGSLRWFDARYGLALAYYRDGKADEARRLIDATSILHPDLGGGDLQGKFIRLRQRLLPDGGG